MSRITTVPRSSGVLLHPTSLPGGRLGPEAYAFVDWLAAAGQSWWQVLPLVPPDEAGSPYTSPSAFAAWDGLLADPDARVEPSEVRSFADRHPFWASDWETFAGPGALEGQVRFEREWTALRVHAGSRGVRLIGDLPIYVSPGGADRVLHPELFAPGVVAGAPPDDLGATGQLWGNPVYDWPALRRRGYRFFVERLRRGLELTDLIRVDHFRGFVSFWTVPEGAATAAGGRWHRGPGAAPFHAARAALGRLPLIVEDLGHITPAVERLRDGLELPGMAVLQLGFGGGRGNPHRPGNLHRRLVVYTGTHDMDTVVGWWRRLTRERQVASGLDPAAPNWSLVELAYRSRAGLAVVPVQDLLGLGSEARMNTPGTASGNWSWRLEPGALDDALAARLRRLSLDSGRLGAKRARSGRARPSGLRPHAS